MTNLSWDACTVTFGGIKYSYPAVEGRERGPRKVEVWSKLKSLLQCWVEDGSAGIDGIDVGDSEAVPPYYVSLRPAAGPLRPELGSEVLAHCAPESG